MVKQLAVNQEIDSSSLSLPFSLKILNKISINKAIKNFFMEIQIILVKDVKSTKKNRKENETLKKYQLPKKNCKNKNTQKSETS